VFWDKIFNTKGLSWPEDYARRLNPDLPLQDNIRNLLPFQSYVHILDVGAGPLTALGKRCSGIQLHITAVDALADIYDRILRRYGVEPPVRTQMVDAERLTSRFASSTFDLVYALNSIDHSYDPQRAILEMLSVVNPKCYVLLEHAINEGENMGYRGLHQWNFSSKDEEFIIRGKNSVVNITEKYSKLCSITCEISERDNSRGGKIGWLVVKMRKSENVT
jgi:SAM-dependent methyltransferase